VQVCPQPGTGAVEEGGFVNPWLDMMEATLGPINTTNRYTFSDDEIECRLLSIMNFNFFSRTFSPE
jgi:hypothetical protein